MFGLYDHQGVLRCTGRDLAECLAYVDLFAMAPDSYSVTDLASCVDGDAVGALSESLLPIG